MNNLKIDVPIQVKDGKWDYPIADKNRLDLIICGSRSKLNEMSCVNIHTCSCEQSGQEFRQIVKHYFSVESFGTNTNVEIVNQLMTLALHDIIG